MEEDPKAQLEEPAATRAINPPMQTQYMSPQMPSPPQPPLQQTYPAPMPFQVTPSPSCSVPMVAVVVAIVVQRVSRCGARR